MTTLERRVHALERRSGSGGRTSDQARMEATCRVLARELGISEAELRAEATQLAQERARFPNRAAHLRHVAAGWRFLLMNTFSPQLLITSITMGLEAVAGRLGTQRIACRSAPSGTERPRS